MHIAALKFLYGTTLRRPEEIVALPWPKVPHRLPDILSGHRGRAVARHLDMCDACGDARPAYNSCRNRHCPKCQCLRQAKWVADRMERVLPTHHFHVVFTVPEECKPLALRNRIRFFEILFASASRTLLQLGFDPDRCGALIRRCTAEERSEHSERLIHPFGLCGDSSRGHGLRD